MAITGTITINGSSSGINASSVVSKSAGANIPIDEAVAAAQTDLLFNIAFDKDRLKMVYLLSTEDLTIETNSGSAADDTISLVANEPLIWYDGQSGATNPFSSADVTAWYLTNTDALTLTGFILHDPTA